jgi:hypothetical protein
MYQREHTRDGSAHAMSAEEWMASIRDKAPPNLPITIRLLWP